MGQIFSRRIAGGLQKGMHRHQKAMENEALQQIKEREQAGIRFPDSTGFQRGTGRLQPRKELEQEAFLEKQQQNPDTDMPKDLIQFLNDVGPLQREVDTALTSPRLRDQTMESLLPPPADSFGANQTPRRQRQRRTMSLVEPLTDGDMESQVGDGMTTTRTANFSRTQRHGEGEVEAGLKDLDLYRLLTANNRNDKSVEKSLLERSNIGGDKEKETFARRVLQTGQILADSGSYEAERHDIRGSLALPCGRADPAATEACSGVSGTTIVGHTTKRGGA